MIQIGTYVHGGGNIEEKIIAIKNAGFDFVAIGMGALSDGSLEYQVELCKKYGLDIDNIHLTGGKTTEIWFEGELGDKVTDADKQPVKDAIEKLRATLAGGDTEAIKADTEALEKSFYAISEKLYAQQGGAQGAGKIAEYFEKRNIHFYVNVCGFHITEFFNFTLSIICLLKSRLKTIISIRSLVATFNSSTFPFLIILKSQFLFF